MNSDGTIRWRANIPRAAGSLAIASDGTVIVTGGATVSALRGSASLASSDWPRAWTGTATRGRRTRRATRARHVAAWEGTPPRPGKPAISRAICDVTLR